MKTSQEATGLLFLMVFGVVWLIVLFVAIYHILQAVWALREGASKEVFLRRGMLAGGLLVLVFLVPYLTMVTLGMVRTSANVTPVQQTQQTVQK
ncbi:MAG: hypothetical protein IRZ10_06400 [Thermoflavifilum sp.]|nr:hypothetical protein [Thermoflavifilum sp.]MCL6514036.1 hypothetical protein [Alicyclobacillus sp.]